MMAATVQLSWWEHQTYFESVDLLIVGGGIVGLNAALSAKMMHPDLRVLLIDRGMFLPYGASTRNAGFACYGSMTELLDDLCRMTHAEVFDLVEKRYSGLVRLRELLGDEVIGYEPLGGYEVFRPAEAALFDACREKMDLFNAELQRIAGKKSIYSVCDDKIDQFGFGGIRHMILNSGEGQINSGKMMQALLQKVRSLGVEVLTGIGVEQWEKDNEGLRVMTSMGFDIKAGKLLITTNAFAKQLLPELEVMPGRAQVLVTSPIENLKVKGTFHYDKGYYYFRNVGDRILLGGGRNLDFKSEETYEFGLTPVVQNTLEQLLQDVILPGQKYSIEHRWSGIMGLGPVKSAIVKAVQSNVFCAVRMGGMGVAIGSHIGREAAELVLG